MNKVFAVFEVEAPNGMYLKKLLISFESAQHYVDFLRSKDPNGYYMIRETEVEEFIPSGVTCP